MEFNSPAHTRHFGLQTRRKDAHLVSSNLRREMTVSMSALRPCRLSGLSSGLCTVSGLSGESQDSPP